MTRQTIEHYDPDDPDFPAIVKDIIQKAGFTDEDLGRDWLRGLLEYMSRTGQLSPTSTSIETTKTANKVGTMEDDA